VKAFEFVKAFIVKACEFVKAFSVRVCEFQKLESLSRKASEFRIESLRVIFRSLRV
jgi:hypothetical protein